LSAPLGYWNALGGFAALRAVVALGIATEPAARRSVRMLAAATLVPLPLTLFFTFSRGAWVALGGGVLVLVSCSARPMRVLGAGARGVCRLHWPGGVTWGRTAGRARARTGTRRRAEREPKLTASPGSCSSWRPHLPC